MLIAIDYGSKLAGTTVLAQFSEERPLSLLISEKKKDADDFLLKILSEIPPATIFIDAPLSLPGKYRYPDEFQDFFYRQADRELNAMSPMFLGGLTARAMKLKANLEVYNHKILEAYPGALARKWDLKKKNYKKEKKHIPEVLQLLSSKIPIPIQFEDFPTWHHVDALLALFSAYRYSKNQQETYGIFKEGQIFI